MWVTRGGGGTRYYFSEATLFRRWRREVKRGETRGPAPLRQIRTSGQPRPKREREIRQKRTCYNIFSPTFSFLFLSPFWSGSAISSCSERRESWTTTLSQIRPGRSVQKGKKINSSGSLFFNFSTGPKSLKAPWVRKSEKISLFLSLSFLSRNSPPPADSRGNCRNN